MVVVFEFRVFYLSWFVLFWCIAFVGFVGFVWWFVFVIVDSLGCLLVFGILCFVCFCLILLVFGFGFGYLFMFIVWCYCGLVVWLVACFGMVVFVCCVRLAGGLIRYANLQFLPVLGFVGLT